MKDHFKALDDLVAKFQEEMIRPFVEIINKEVEDIMKTEQQANKDQVLANDKDIVRQVPGILQDHTGVKKPQALRNEELFFRANNK